MLPNKLGLDNFSSLVDASPMPTAIYIGKDMMISIANQSMLQLWGKSKSVIGFPLLQAIPELIGQPFFDILTEVFISGKTYEAKEDPADLIVDGLLQRFYFTFTYKAIRDDAGDVIGIFNTATDVTELVTARKLVDETRQRLSFALSSAKVGTWDLDPLNNHVEWDERCKVLFGFMGNSDVVYE
ncbi:MAG: PAS domain-containing sensor histidine kinase, partial [Pedobacter sp.]